MTLADQYRELVKNDKTLSKDRRLCDEAVFDVQYPTGFIGIDYGLAQKIHVENPDKNMDYWYDSIGIVDGSINMLVARSGGGKTTLSTEAGGNIVKPFEGASIFIDSVEGGLTERRAEVLLRMSPQERQHRVHIRNNVTQESFFKKIKLIHDFKMEHYDELQYECEQLDSRGNKIFKLEPTITYLTHWLFLLQKSFRKKMKYQVRWPQQVQQSSLLRYSDVLSLYVRKQTSFSS